ncbi:MAG: hypothetical protein EBX50_09425 [Chitinophagia bacterium]|nr:hypothetical protein [Chitinophagia bacterium]
MITNTPFQKLNLYDQSDAVGRFRVSNPQSLIDTDFEYGLQGTKWETLELVNGQPGPVYRPSEPQFAGNQQIISIVGSPNQRGANLGGHALNGTMRVTTAFQPAIPFAVGNPITVKFTGSSGITLSDSNDGTGVITAVISPTVFEYKSNTDNFTSTSTNVVSEKTIIYTGQWASGSKYSIGAIYLLSNSLSAEMQFTNSYYPYPGTQFTLVDPISVNDYRYPWCGNFSWDGFGNLTGLGTSNACTFITPFSSYPPNLVTINTSSGLSAFPNPTGYVQQRTTDGGVMMIPSTTYSIPITGTAATEIYNGPLTFNMLNNIPRNTQIIRQTRKYFRYQSGKSLLFSTGILFKPVLEVANWSAQAGNVNAPSVLNLQFDTDHGMVGARDPRTSQIDNSSSRYNRDIPFKIPTRIKIEGFNDVSGASSPWNGVFDVYRVNSSYNLQIAKPFVSADIVTPTGLPRVTVVGWYDAAVRSGLFDDNNGAFFEFDGTNLNVVKRNSVTTVGYKFNITKFSCSLTQTLAFPRMFDILFPMDRLSIRGSNYTVNHLNNTSTGFRGITAPYRGINAIGNTIVSKVVEERVPQSRFNLDKLDGTGPSGYTINLDKMQMVFMDYSWYGAGKIRFGIRGNDGNIIWFHEFINNNVNTEAYFRSGNLPARFEINTYGKPIKLLGYPNNLGVSRTSPESFPLSASFNDSLYLPISGQIFYNGEVINYTKTNQNPSLNVCELSAVNRWQFGGTRWPNYFLNLIPNTLISGDTMFSFNHNCAPTLSHWGVSVLMDGGFTVDKSYLFTAATLSAVSVPAGIEVPLISIRMGPSADYGIAAQFGARNNINRGQLVLDSVGLAAVGSLQAILRINPTTDVFTQRLSGWTNVGAGSIAQYFDHTVQENDTFSPVLKPRYTGGDVAGAFFCDEGIGRLAVTTKDINAIRELGNCILGGDNTHPDGPDVLTISVRNVGTTVGATSAIARLTWTEAQG